MATEDSMEIVARTVRVDFGELPEKSSKVQQKQEDDDTRSSEGAVVPGDWCVTPAAVFSRFIRCFRWVRNGVSEAECDCCCCVRRYAGNAALTEIFHALSITFPVGETFFIDSVMHYAPRLKRDHPKLWKDVRICA